MRTPARVTITSPPNPDRATAASAHIEAARGMSLTVCGTNDRKPIARGLSLGVGDAMPGSHGARANSLVTVKIDAATRPNVAASALPAAGTPGTRTPASSRTNRNCEATDAFATADRPAPPVSSDRLSIGTPSARPIKNE